MAPTSSKKNTPSTRSKSFLKRWVWVPVVLILTLVIILSQFDLESVKENLIQKVYDETGLKVEIDSIGFGFSNGLGLQCKGVKVSTPAGDHYSVDRLDLLAAWSPLLKGEFKIKSAALEHPVIKLEIPEPSQPPTKKEESLPDKSQPSDGPIAPEVLQSATDKLKNTPIAIDEFIISDGEITLTRSGSTKQLLLNVDGTFVLNRGKGMDISAKSVKIQTGSILLEGDGKVSNLALNNAGIEMNLQSDDFSLEKLKPVMQFFGVSAKEALAPLEKIDVDHLLLKAAFPLNSLTQVDELKKQMVGEIELKIRNAILKMKDRFTIESLEGKASWNNGVLDHNFSGRVLESDFSISGKLPFADLEKDSNSRVEWKNLDLKKLPLEKGMAWKPTQGITSGSIFLTGPLPKEIKTDKLNGTFDIQVQNLVVKPASAKQGNPIELSQLKASGSLKEGLLNHDIQITLWGGEFGIKGNVRLPPANPVLDSSISWKNLDVAQLPLPKDTAWRATEGIVAGTINLAGPVPEKGGSFPGQLKGSLKFDAQNLKLQGKDAPPLAFSKLTINGELKKDLLNHDIQATIWGGEFRVKGNVRLPLAKPVLDSNISWKNLDVAQLPLPKDTAWRATEGVVSGTLKLKGPVPGEGKSFPGQIKTSLKFDAQNLKLQGKDSPDISLARLEGDGSIANNKVSYKLKADVFNGTIKSDGKVSLGSTKPVLNNKIELTNIDLSQLPLPTTPEKGIVSGTIKLKGPLPDPENLLTGKLNIDTSFKVEDLNISAGTLPLNIQRFEGKVNLKQGKLTHNLNGTLFGGTIKTKGHLTFQKNKAQTLITSDSNLSLDKVSLDWVPLIQKSEWAPSSGTLTGDLNIKGPLPSGGDAPLKLKLAGTLLGEKLILGKPERAIDTIKLNFKESPSALFKAEVTAEKIQLDTRSFKKALALINFSPEKIDLTRAEIWPMNGRIQLVGNFQPESGNYRMKFRGKKLRVEDLSPPHIKGPLEFSGAIVGRLPKNTDVPELPDYARELSGNMKINLVEGTIPELGVLENLLNLLNLNIGGGQKAGLVYDYIRGDFKIKKGVVDTQNLALKGPQITMTVKGQADLVKDSVNAEVKAVPLQVAEKIIKAIPLLGQILGGGEKGGILEIYIKVSGKLSEPSFIPLPHKSLTEKPASILEGILNLPKNLNKGR